MFLPLAITDTANNNNTADIEANPAIEAVPVRNIPIDTENATLYRSYFQRVLADIQSRVLPQRPNEPAHAREMNLFMPPILQRISRAANDWMPDAPSDELLQRRLFFLRRYSVNFSVMLLASAVFDLLFLAARLLLFPHFKEDFGYQALELIASSALGQWVLQGAIAIGSAYGTLQPGDQMAAPTNEYNWAIQMIATVIANPMGAAINQAISGPLMSGPAVASYGAAIGLGIVYAGTIVGFGAEVVCEAPCTQMLKAIQTMGEHITNILHPIEGVLGDYSIENRQETD